ncbi:MAG TPA: hypothetical protein VFL57_09930, partial [Bryobacteraceae bacterium]|nr:hypothetical protein [Bryobacteraceae bacterium]
RSREDVRNFVSVLDNYRPAYTALIPIPANGGSPTDPLSAYYDSNTVFVTLKNGSWQQPQAGCSSDPAG